MGIRDKKILHTTVVEKEQMPRLVSNVVKQNSITVRVPATSANLGSGFDCTGIAFKKYNVFTFDKTASGVEFEGFHPNYSNENNLCYVAYKAVCDAIGKEANVKIKNVKNDIPISRGLGSSAALIVAGAYAANRLNGSPLNVQQVFEICNSIEGHPDNIAPALFGGLCTSIVANGKPRAQKYTVSDAVCFTAIIPDFKVDTKDARSVLPQNISREDAIFNMQRVALLPHVFEHGSSELIKLVTEDRIHERYRKPLYKNIDLIEKAAYECGAISFIVSGAGPTCLAFSAIPIAKELNEKIANLENNWVAFSVSVDNEGAKEIYDEQ
jgi:homoserine kinase